MSTRYGRSSEQEMPYDIGQKLRDARTIEDITCPALKAIKAEWDAERCICGQPRDRMYPIDCCPHIAPKTSEVDSA